MANTFTEQTFRSSYKDDHNDSDGYHRILFNAGRALQARELTQMQTILQKEISRFADNIFQKDGVPVSAGGVSVNNAYAFFKIQSDLNNAFDDPTALQGVTLTGATSGLKVKVLFAVPAIDGDPDTLYIQYLDNPTRVSVATRFKTAATLVPGETISNGSDINMVTQTTNTNENPAFGFGSTIAVGESTFYVNGHFVFIPKQTIFLGKYTNFETHDVGFKLIQDIVTVNDTEALYDNQNITPNRASPGADRYRLRMVLTKRSDFALGETFVYFASVQSGRVIRQVKSTDGYNQIKKFVNTRIKEINGDFIKKYWKLRFDPNANISSDYLMMKIDPGTAYIDGHRASTTVTQSIPLKKAIDTIIDEDEQIGVDYGNFYFFDSGQGMLDIDQAEPVTLYSGFDGTGTQIGLANVRAITEGINGKRYSGEGLRQEFFLRDLKYKVHLFNVNRTDFTKTLEDVKSIKSVGNSDLVNLVPLATGGQTRLFEPRKTALMIDTPLPRPKSFTNCSMTFMRKENFTTGSGQTTYNITLTDAGESFTREADIIIASSTEFPASGATANIAVGNSQVNFTGLVQNTAYEVILFVTKTNATVKTKTLTSGTVTGLLSNEGVGIDVLELGKSDVYEISRIRAGDSDGEDLFPYFSFDAGTKLTHYDDSRLVWSGGGLDSAQASQVFVRFKYFDHSPSGEFYAVNSYTGQLDYLKIPAQNLPEGGQASLRDVIDLRPSTDGSGSFANGVVPPLPVPTDTIQSTAEYYLPRNDKLVVSRTGELRVIQGTPSLNPKFPAIPEDTMDLYKIRLNPNTLHSRDLKTTMIPRKGYTMADINSLENKIDRLEEMTVLSLLELNTKFLQVLDSDGLDRTKSGFFVDSFKNHAYSQTRINGRRNPQYRASINAKGKTLQPRFKQGETHLTYDPANSKQLRTVKKDNFVMLDYVSRAHNTLNQELASNTENLAPFYVPISLGDLKLSPETDNWFEEEIVGEQILGTKTEFDLDKALNWNSSENEWYGIDPSELEVGDQSKSFISGVSSTVDYDSKGATLIGSDVSVALGEWVETGHVTDVEILSTTTVEVGRETETREVDRQRIDAWWNYMNYWYENWNYSYYNGQYWGWNGYWNGYYYQWSVDQVTSQTWDIVTTETRDKVRTTNTSTYEQTKTITTTNEYEGIAEITTTTTTENTVNRISSESTLRDVVGRKVVELTSIPFMRSVDINFKCTGLRPNTQYFPFFDNTNVSTFCRSQTFKTMSAKDVENSASENDGNGTQKPTQEHSAGYTTLVSDAEGILQGQFELPNNNFMRFHTGKREFMLTDVNSADTGGAMSFAKALFVSAGTLEEYEEEVYITRILHVTGATTYDIDREMEVERTTWTDTVVTEEVAEDVRSSSTTTTIVTGTETTEEFVSEDITYERSDGTSIQPPDHTDTEEEETPPGGTTKASTTYDTDEDIEAAVDEGEYGAYYNQTGSNNISRADEGRSQGAGFNASTRGGRSQARHTDVGSIHHDPVAQTFSVEETSGLNVTSVTVYFSSKSSAAANGVKCEIRPTVQGVPSSSQSLCSTHLKPSQINLVPSNPTNKTVLQNGTTFTFDAPQYLSRGEYAIVLTPDNNDTNYNVYVATVGENAVGGNQTFISQQPATGVFFKSQNSQHWEPASNTDLTFRINVANFKTSGNAIFENINVPPKGLGKDPLVMDSGSNIVRVMMEGHGLRTGDKAWIRGIDSAENLGNGLTGVQVIGKRTVIRADNSGYTYQADATATSRKWFGGQQVTSTLNKNYENLRVIINPTLPKETTFTPSIKTTTQSSLAGTETRFVKDSKFIPIESDKQIRFKTPRAIYNRSTELQTGSAGLSGERSLTLQCTLKTTNPLVSPIIDLETLGCHTMHNLITKQTSGVEGTQQTLTFGGYSNGEKLNLVLEATDPRVGAVRLNNTFATGEVVAQGYPSFRRGYVFQGVAGDSDGLIISRSDGLGFTTKVHTSTTGTWTVSDGTTTVNSTDHATGMSVSANTPQTTVSGYNVPLTYVPETHPDGGSESAKHITKVTTLATDATGLKIFLAANKPKVTNFQVYWRTSTGGESIFGNPWNLVQPEVDLLPDSNKNVFREYEYLVGGDNGTLVKFTQFQIKIVMQSTNTAEVPKFRDLRVIALAV